MRREAARALRWGGVGDGLLDAVVEELEVFAAEASMKWRCCRDGDADVDALTVTRWAGTAAIEPRTARLRGAEKTGQPGLAVPQ